MLHKKELCDFYRSHSIVRVVKSRFKIGWISGHTAQVEETELKLVQNFGQGTRYRPRRRQENIKICLKELCCKECVQWQTFVLVVYSELGEATLPLSLLHLNHLISYIYTCPIHF
jgi:hypothetical protein